LPGPLSGLLPIMRPLDVSLAVARVAVAVAALLDRGGRSFV